MSAMPSGGLVNARDHAALARAAGLLEQTSFAMKVAGMVGRPAIHALAARRPEPTAGQGD